MVRFLLQLMQPSVSASENHTRQSVTLQCMWCVEGTEFLGVPKVLGEYQAVTSCRTVPEQVISTVEHLQHSTFSHPQSSLAGVSALFSTQTMNTENHSMAGVGTSGDHLAQHPAKVGMPRSDCHVEGKPVRHDAMSKLSIFLSLH